MEVDLQAGKNIKVASIKMTAVVDQAIKGIQDSVMKTLQEQGAEVKASSTTDQLLDGFMSGSTFTKIVYIVVIGGGLISIVILALKLAFGKSDTDTTQQYAQQAYYNPYDQSAYYQQQA